MAPCRPEQGDTGRTVVQTEALVSQAERGRAFGSSQVVGRIEPDDWSLQGLRVKHQGRSRHHAIGEGNLQERVGYDPPLARGEDPWPACETSSRARGMS